MTDETSPPEGFLSVNKPRGITSFDVIRVLRKTLKLRKMGHAGTLDPIAEGVLVIGVGRATRFLPYITDLPKEYVARVRLGAETDTLDADGKTVKEAPVPALTESGVREVLEGFIGTIEQTPPAYSAQKQKGKRLYRLAREGVKVVPRPKRVRLFEMELLELGESWFDVRALVGKGVYLRSIARDAARQLGTVGHVESLTRTKVGRFTVEEALGPQSAALDELIPITDGLSHLPQATLESEALENFRHGSRISTLGYSTPPGVRVLTLVRVLGHSGRFVGVARVGPDGLQPVTVLS